METFSRRPKAFTLVEVLVVMGIIGVLAAISIFGLKTSRDKAKISKAKVQMSNYGIAIQQYHNEHLYDSTISTRWPEDVSPTTSMATCGASSGLAMVPLSL